MDNSTCLREGCNQDTEWAMGMFCSEECARLQRELAAKQLFARFEDEPVPTMDDLLDRNERAKRWTPETMDERIAELKDAYCTLA